MRSDPGAENLCWFSSPSTWCDAQACCVRACGVQACGAKRRPRVVTRVSLTRQLSAAAHLRGLSAGAGSRVYADKARRCGMDEQTAQASANAPNQQVSTTTSGAATQHSNAGADKWTPI